MERFGQGRVAVVTGSTRGIGRGVATDLADHGFRVIVNYASNHDEAQTVVADIESRGGEALAVQADVGDPSAGKAIFDAAEESFGAVDVLVNNAGALLASPIAEMSRTEFDRIMAINVGGTFATVKEAATRMRAQGRIVNVSSTALHVSLANYVAYNAAKAAIEAMTRVLAKEFAPREITVNAIAPGPVATELFYRGKSEEMVRRMEQLSPFNRLGDISDIVPAIRFLCHPDSRWVSGQVVRVNGGAG